MTETTWPTEPKMLLDPLQKVFPYSCSSRVLGVVGNMDSNDFQLLCQIPERCGIEKNLI